jgi:hypothetical protein
VEIEFWDDHSNWIPAIEGFVVSGTTTWAAAARPARLTDASRNESRRIMSDHVNGHVVHPFQDLRANVGQEGVGKRTSKDHDIGHQIVGKEEPHGCA